MNDEKKNLLNTERRKEVKQQVLGQLLVFQSYGRFSQQYCQVRFMDIWKETNFPDERNGVRRQSRGTKDQLIIDEMIMRNRNRRMKNLSAT